MKPLKISKVRYSKPDYSGAILKALQAIKEFVNIVELSEAIYGANPTAGQKTVVKNAINTLKKKGKVVSSYAKGRKAKYGIHGI